MTAAVPGSGNIWKQRMAGVFAGPSAGPLAVLAALYFFDEFDTSAFGVLAPDIKRAFHLTDRSFSAVVLLNLSIVLLLAIPAGHLADRGPRRILAAASGVAAGAFSLATGMVGGVIVLLLVRIGNGLGNLSNTTVQPSLLADYTAAEFRPTVFSVYQASPAIGAIVGGVVSGGLASLFGWRAPFFIFFVPIVLVALACLRLREPLRGGSDDPDSALALVGEEAVPFREAARNLWAIPTLRRQFMAYAFIGAGLLPLAFTLPLFYQKVFHMGAFARGALSSVFSAASLIGTLVIGPRCRAWVTADVAKPLRYVAYVTMVIGGLIVLMAEAPNEWMTMAVSVVLGLAAGTYAPPFVTIQSVVAPARVRSLAFSFSALFLVAGVIGLYLITPVSALGDTHGLRTGLAALGPYWLIAGFILLGASGTVADDAASALRSLAALVEVRRKRSQGSSALLSCAGVDVAYSSVQVLFGVDFEVAEGEIVALLGTNGAGKSTLLKAISGVVVPSAGSVIFDGQDITYLDARSKFEAGIVQMPGGRSVFPTLTVDECLSLAEWSSRGGREEVGEALAQVREYFPILERRSDTMAGDLSGGEQQMLGLAMAFIARPRLLMIDELSLGLAPAIVSQLVDIVRAIHHRGTTVIIVEQSVNVALTLAQRAVFMEKGEVRFTGPTSELLGRSDILRAVFLEGAVAGSNGDSPRKTRTGTRKSPVPANRDRLLANPAVLRLEDVSVHYGGIRAVNDVSLTLHEGEILGIIGPNGSGKTTLFDAISGFAPSTSGSVRLGGTEVGGWGPDRRARAGLGRSFQDARLFPSLTVVENLALALERHLAVRDPLACALGLPPVYESEAAAAAKVHELVDLLGLDAFRNKFVSELSTGTRRMVDLAMAIAHDPKVLLLDEPSSGIAQRETEALGPVLKRIQAEVGCAMLVIEHDMPLVTSIADTLVALESGRLIAEGPPQLVLHDPRVVASYLGDNEDAIFRSGRRAPTRGRRPRGKAGV